MKAVFPVTGDPLLGYPRDNLLVTLHIARAMGRSRRDSIHELAENVSAFLASDERKTYAPMICRAHCTTVRTRGDARS
jgi:lactate dehydrogenase-like 2-hydroxyacid dehydrogenase